MNIDAVRNTVLSKKNSADKTKSIFYSLAEWIAVVFAFIIISYLTFLVFMYCFNSENSFPMHANIFAQAIATAFVLGGIKLLAHFLNSHVRICKWISAICFVVTIVLVAVSVFSYVSQTLLLPISDEKSCFDIALRFLKSEFGAVVPEGSYLSLWPYQTGLIFITEKLMRIFNVDNPLFFQQVNCIYILLIVTSGYCIIRILSSKIEGHILYLLLMGNYWSLFFKVSSVYGDLPGLAWTMVSMACYILFCKVDKRWEKILSVLGFVLSTILACIYKGNCLIYIIAVLLITLVLQLRKFQPVFIVVVVITAFVSIFSTDITQKYYEHYAGNVCGKGMPASGWLAMGLQYNGEEAIPGGWNGFHTETFISSGYDYDASNTIFKKAIQKSLKEFCDNPEFAGKFFFNKTLKQWANQTHGVWWGTNCYYDVSRDESSFWVQFLNYGKYNEYLSFMDFHESIVYATLFVGSLFLLLAKIKKQKIDIFILLPLVTFIGGFLFSLIWEGQTSTVMSYPIMVLPVAVAIWAEARFNCLKNRHEP